MSGFHLPSYLQGLRVLWLLVFVVSKFVNLIFCIFGEFWICERHLVKYDLFTRTYRLRLQESWSNLRTYSLVRNVDVWSDQVVRKSHRHYNLEVKTLDPQYGVVKFGSLQEASDMPLPQSTQWWTYNVAHYIDRLDSLQSQLFVYNVWPWTPVIRWEMCVKPPGDAILPHCLYERGIQSLACSRGQNLKP